MIDQQSGHIVTITSIVGKIGTPMRTSYSTSKHALHGFFDSLRAEIDDKNVKILLVCPGYVKTNVSINAYNAEGAKQGTMDATTANGLNPDNVAQQIIKVIQSNKQEVLIAGTKEKIGVLLKQFLPRLFSKIIKKNKSDLIRN